MHTMNSTERQERYELMLQRAVDARLTTLNRRSMLRSGAVVAGSALAFGTAGRALAQDATPVPVEGDVVAEEAPFAGPIDVLNYALTLEHIESAFYRDGLLAIGVDGISGLGFQDGVYDYLSEIALHEADHVVVLSDVITQLGGTPVSEAVYDFGYTDAAGFLQVAQALEDTGVAAYTGAAQFLIESDELLTAALTIHGVEARHAAYLAILNGGNPYPDAFNAPLTPAEVLDIATPFIQG
jgi:hypothetical protein